MGTLPSLGSFTVCVNFTVFVNFPEQVWEPPNTFNDSIFRLLKCRLAISLPLQIGRLLFFEGKFSLFSYICQQHFPKFFLKCKSQACLIFLFLCPIPSCLGGNTIPLLRCVMVEPEIFMDLFVYLLSSGTRCFSIILHFVFSCCQSNKLLPHPISFFFYHLDKCK